MSPSMFAFDTMLQLLRILALLILCTPALAQECLTSSSMISAAKITKGIPGLPEVKDWSAAHPVRFCHDWQGQNPDPLRETEVRMLWSPEMLYIRFHARYRSLYTYPNRDQRQPELWERDVAEVFLQPPELTGRNYTELEISPNGDWLDLTIAEHETLDMNCTMQTRVVVDEKQKTWTAQMAIPMQCMTKHFDPAKPWRLNLFRIEGAEPERFYSSWQPTHTDKPNFHVPQVFATLTFEQ